ncbi:MAG: twin-arginine translocase TatA/TatE family subunit [Deltaproteobacteria bacterium]|nr:twin-arginine translocase TatA/TatE family subunit [Deltaproteobacteria bacterium]
MFGILGFIKPGLGELIVILIILLLLFGARKLPEIGASIGAAIKEFKKSIGDKKEDPK